MNRLIAAVAAMTLSAAGAAAQRDRLAIDTTELGRRLRNLSADSMLGRLPGTKGETLTTSYLIRELTSFGVRPGANGGWLQPVTIGTHRPSPDAAAPTARLSGRLTRELEHGRDLRFANYSRAADVTAGGDLVFVGYGINAPLYGWNDFEGVDLKGKVVIALLGEPVLAGDSVRFNGGRASRFSWATDKIDEMAARGAVGVLWVRPTGSISRAPVTGPSYVVTQGSPGTVTFIGNIAESVLGELLPSASEQVAALIARAARPGFRAVPLNVRLDLRFGTRPMTINSNNVVGVVPGTDATLAREHVVISAHWDAYGIGAPVNGDSVYNGALDDGSGMTAALALARVFVANPQPRSITFVFTTAEEMGLLGARAFVCSGPLQMDRVVANLNLDDGLELFGPKRDVAPLGVELSSLGRTVAEVARAKGLRVSPDAFPQEGFFLRADNFPFARAGVPALYVALGTDDATQSTGFTVNKTNEYLQRHYHRPSDDYATVVHDLRGALQFAEFTRDLTIAVARSRERPQWNAGAEFSRPTGGSPPPACR
jgi:peptidase M28-like protein